MNGRCHNDPMDFAEDVCDSCGEQFCSSCLVLPRGPKGPPYCTHCAMALSGVRNRRLVKPRSRSEIRKRRKALRAELAGRDSGEKIEFPGTDLINGPVLDPSPEHEVMETSNTKKRSSLVGRFRRRSEDGPEPDPASPDPTEAIEADGELEVLAEDSLVDEFQPNVVVADDTGSPAERSSAAALLEQLRDHDPNSDDDVWLPPVQETPTAAWTLPEIDQAPLGSGGPWGALAAEPVQASAPSGAPDGEDAEPPVFVSEAELRAQGPADTDDSGNWVPPTLRGIAPTAHQEAGALPRRRRRTPADES